VLPDRQFFSKLLKKLEEPWSGDECLHVGEEGGEGGVFSTTLLTRCSHGFILEQKSVDRGV